MNTSTTTSTTRRPAGPVQRSGARVVRVPATACVPAVRPHPRGTRDRRRGAVRW